METGEPDSGSTVHTMSKILHVFSSPTTSPFASYESKKKRVYK